MWKLKLQHRLKLLLWKVAANALPLRHTHREVFIHAATGSPLCPFCQIAAETPQQLFLECQFSTILWRNGPWAFHSDFFVDQPIQKGISYMLDSKNLPRSAKDFWPRLMLAVTIILDTIWLTRNKLVHEAQPPDIMAAIHSVHGCFSDHLAA